MRNAAKKQSSDIPDRGDLSSSNLPNEIKRIELGDEGRVSQSEFVGKISFHS